MRDHVQQEREVGVELVGIAEADNDKAFVRCWNVTRDKRVRGIDCGDTLEVDVGT